MLLEKAWLRTLLARPTGKATKGWATINALQFLESDPWTLFQLLVERLFEEICRIELHGFDGERQIAMAGDDNHGFPLRLKM